MSAPNHENLEDLREQLLSSVLQCENIAQEAQRKKTVLEKTRDLHLTLENDLRKLER
jgi:hypothetical protein